MRWRKFLVAQVSMESMFQSGFEIEMRLTGQRVSAVEILPGPQEVSLLVVHREVVMCGATPRESRRRRTAVARVVKRSLEQSRPRLAPRLCGLLACVSCI